MRPPTTPPAPPDAGEAARLDEAGGGRARDRGVVGRRRNRPPTGLVVVVAVIVAASVLPLAYLAARAAEGGVGRAVSLLLERRTLDTLGDTALLAVVVTTASVALAVPLAWLTTRTDLPGRRAWAVLTAVPLVVPTFVGGFAFVAAFGPRGMLQQTLAPLGVERLPEIYGLPGAALVLTLFSYPYVLLTVRGSLAGLDPSLEDAARSLGHSASGAFRRVTLPQLRPAIGAGGLLVALYVLSDFGAVSLLRYNSLTRFIFNEYRVGFDYAAVATYALVLVAFTLVLLVAESRFRGLASLYRLGAGTARHAGVVRLGRWRWPATGFCAAVVLLALAVPLTVLGFWLTRGLAAGEPWAVVAPAAGAAWSSLRASTLAALVAVLVAVPVAVLAVRYRSRATTVLERATYLGYALPGLVIALALAFFGARWGGPLYQSLAMLVAAYVILFLPQAVGAVRSSLLQVPPTVEEAARSLGRSGARATLEVTVPLVRPGLIAGAALVFLTAMKELPATLLLAPTGDHTLATLTWDAAREAFFARAAAPALLLVLLSTLPMAVLLARRGTTPSL